MLSKAQKYICSVLGFLILANALAWIAIFELSRPKLLEITFFEVGQGDAIFIETPKGHQVLIDGGPDAKILEKLGKEMPFFDKSLDLLILTHPQKDHLGGLLFVLRDYEVERVLWTGVESETEGFKEWLKALEEEKAKTILAQKGLRIRAGKVFIDILYPFESLAGQESEYINDTSIVSHLSFGKTSFLNSTKGRIQGSHEVRFLFTGDISSKIEKELVERDINLSSNVLKVPHHGSKYSSSEEFLQAVSPQLAVIQVGKNSYGHPTSEVLLRLEKLGINVLRTDESGDIKIISDGNNFSWMLKKKKH